MALASFTCAKSVVALSQSPVYHYQYSSITDAVSNLAGDEISHQLLKKQVQDLCLQYFPIRASYDFQTDGVSLMREYSPCLKEREYVYKANNVIGRKQAGRNRLQLLICQSSAEPEQLVVAHRGQESEVRGRFSERRGQANRTDLS